MDYFVYILKNNNGRHYIGITTDPARRLIEHNKGNTKSTRPFKPWKVIYLEKYTDRSQACKREWYLKHPIGYKEKLEIIYKHGGVA